MASCHSSASKSEGYARKHVQAYTLGREDATALLEESPTGEVLRLKLLDVRARMTAISQKVGQQAAEDYEEGFRSVLVERDDSLASVLF